MKAEPHQFVARSQEPPDFRVGVVLTNATSEV